MQMVDILACHARYTGSSPVGVATVDSTAKNSALEREESHRGYRHKVNSLPDRRVDVESFAE